MRRKLTSAVVSLCFLGTLCLQRSTAAAEQSRWMSAGTRPPFPGGGTIMFLPAKGTGLGEANLGLVSSGGSLHGVVFPAGRYGPRFEAWDPADPHHVVAFGVRHADLASYSVDGALHLLRSWRRAPDPQRGALFSPDSSMLASKFAVHGALHLTDLQNGRKRAIDAPRGYLADWVTSGAVAISHGDRVVEFDLRTRRSSVLLNRSRLDRALPGWGHAWISGVSFSQDGGRFVAELRHGSRSAIVIGTRAGRITNVVHIGVGFLSNGVSSAVTWSPDGDAVAYGVTENTSHQQDAREQVLNVRTGQATTIASGAVDYSGWPPAWSPDGRWLLIMDYANDRWVFASRDGTRMVSYPDLGGYPRWGGAGFASPSANVHIGYC